MKRDDFNHGYPQEAWEAARAEARDAMVGVAARRRLIAYSDLVAEIHSLDLKPQDDRLAHLLGEMSTAEHEAGRGMLTAGEMERRSGSRRRARIGSDSPSRQSGAS